MTISITDAIINADREKQTKKERGKKMTKKEYKTLMDLITRYGDACETFGDYMSAKNAEVCYEAKKEIKNFLKKFVKEA